MDFCFLQTQPIVLAWQLERKETMWCMGDHPFISGAILWHLVNLFTSVPFLCWSLVLLLVGFHYMRAPYGKLSEHSVPSTAAFTMLGICQKEWIYYNWFISEEDTKKKKKSHALGNHVKIFTATVTMQSKAKKSIKALNWCTANCLKIHRTVLPLPMLLFFVLIFAELSFT